jgi:hypothetical protein
MGSEIILHRLRVIEVVVHPKEGLMDHASAQSVAGELNEIEMSGKVYPLDPQRPDTPYYVTADTLGVPGDIVKSIRRATPEEIREAKGSGRFEEYVRIRNKAERELIHRQIDEIRSWFARHHEQAREVPHLYPPEGMKGKTILDQLASSEKSCGPHQLLRDFQWAKKVVRAYFPKLPE